jgi:hypothetical protein
VRLLGLTRRLVTKRSQKGWHFQDSGHRQKPTESTWLEKRRKNEDGLPDSPFLVPISSVRQFKIFGIDICFEFSVFHEFPYFQA